MRLVLSSDKLTTEHKEAATDIVDYLKENGHELIGVLIEKRYNLKPMKKYDVENSSAIKFLKENNLHHSTQGWIKENDIEKPIIHISADIRKLDKAFDKK